MFTFWFLFDSVLKHTEKADSIIKNNLQNWDFKRIAELDKILLRMGIIEILFIDQVPPKVSITEMVEISKVYSTEESPKFINGILDSVYNNYMKHKKSWLSMLLSRLFGTKSEREMKKLAPTIKKINQTIEGN